MRTIRLRERQCRVVRLRRADLDHLLALHPGVIDVVPTLERGLYRLTPRGWVGSIQSPDCRFLISPKIPLSSLSLFLYPECNLHESSGEVAPAIDTWLLDLFAERLAVLMRDRAAHGLFAGYLEENQSGQTLRGRLDLAAQQRESIRGGQQLHGIADNLTVNVPVNQIPLALARQVCRTRLDGALQEWEAVTPMCGSVQDLLAGDVPAGYRPLLEWCRLIEDTLRPESGTTAEVNVLLNLESAFERHLTRGTVEACRGSVVSVGVQSWHHTQPPQFAFHPDIVLSLSGQVVVVVDAKWKTLNPVSLDAGDVQQVLAYAAALGALRAVLVYPGKHNQVWTYNLPHSEIRLEIRTLKVEGTPKKCQVALHRLGRELRAIAK